MTTMEEKYRDLIILAQNFLKQEYPVGERLFVDPIDYLYFYDYAVKSKKKMQSRQEPLIQKTETAVRASQPEPVERPAVISVQPLSVSDSTKKTTKESAQSSTIEIKGIDTSKSISPLSEGLQFFIPGAPSPATKENTAELFTLVAKTVPHLQLIKDPPPDDQGRLIANAWQQQQLTSQILILTFDEVTTHLEFLTNVEKAIRARGYTVGIINGEKWEKENRWNSVIEGKPRLIIGSYSGITSSPHLFRFYSESTKNAKHFIEKIELLLLSDISFYLKEPSLKLSLWNAIKEQLPLLTLPK